MNSFLKKINRKISNIIKRIQNQIRINRIEKSTKRLKELKRTDYKRWKKNSELFENWNERTKILADYISPKARVIEFGAGNMFLKDYLNPEYYTPTDIVKRFEEIVLCDLNNPIVIDLKKYDTAVFSGVLEYVYDINNVFAQLSKNKINQVVLSYCCSDIVKLSREKNGWLSDLTKVELENIFKINNYYLKEYQEWNNQSIFAIEFNDENTI